MPSTLYEAGLAVGRTPDTSCRENPHPLETEGGQEWYAGWYLGYAERLGWSLTKIEDERLQYLYLRSMAHAHRYYENGWDIVVEAMDTHEVLEHLKPEMTIVEAIKAVAEGEYLEAHADRANDALGAGGLKTIDYIEGV